MDPQETEEKMAAPEKSEETAGPLTLILCGAVALAFVLWIAWLSMGSPNPFVSNGPMSEAQMRRSIEEAEKADPELKSMLAPPGDKLLAKNADKTQAKLDVNTATPEQLSKVPGLNEWDVGAIVRLRPFKSVDELLSKKALGESRYRAVADKLTVK